MRSRGRPPSYGTYSDACARLPNSKISRRRSSWTVRLVPQSSTASTVPRKPLPSLARDRLTWPIPFQETSSGASDGARANRSRTSGSTCAHLVIRSQSVELGFFRNRRRWAKYENLVGVGGRLGGWVFGGAGPF